MHHSADLTRTFRDHDRRILLTERGIGPLVLERLQQMGLYSIDDIRVAGVETVLDRICLLLGGSGWANRKRAFQRALDRADLQVV